MAKKLPKKEGKAPKSYAMAELISGQAGLGKCVAKNP